jgi:type IV pilus assembly protein PilF
VLVVLVVVAGGCPLSNTRLDPDGSEKRYLLGADYFHKGLVAPALEELTKAVELNPNNAEAHNLIGLVWLRKAADAEELSTRAQCLKGEEARLEKQEMDTQFKKAEESFKRAIAAKTGYSEAENSMSVVALHFGRYDEAVQHAEKALSNILYRDPFYAKGNLGWAYLLKNDYARASKALREALFDQPSFCVGRYRLAKVYYEQKEYDRAQEELDKVTGDKACPLQEAFHLAGLVALRKQERDRAGELFQKCVSLAPKACLARECTLAASR